MQKEINKNLENYKISKEEVERCKKVWISSEVMATDNVEAMVSSLINDIIEYDERCDYQPGILIDTVGFCGWYDHETQSDKLAYLMQQVAYIMQVEIFYQEKDL